ncbi:MAG: hypothetical protein KJ964_08100 [Verrucomicrobia bacterium]|nr:hypothetical protein [Verrucomicrobiota bacterium]
MSKHHHEVADRIIPMIREVFAEKRPCDKLGMTFQFREKGWSLSPEEAELFHDAVRVLASAFPSVHQKTCSRELERFCCEHIPGHGVAFEAAVPSLLSRLDELGRINNTVYIEISGIRLELPEIDVGPVKIIPSTHCDIDKHRLTIKDINGNYPPPVDAGVLLAMVEVTGEPQFAKEVAQDQAQTALDCLQVLSIQENHAAFENSFGFVLACSEPMPLICCHRWMYSDIEPTWSYDKACGPTIATNNPKLNLPLNQAILAKLQKRGLSFANDLLRESSPSPFDEGVLAAIRWIASAIRERDFTRKYLAFHIAIEALFARDNFAARNSTGYLAPSVPVDEGIAYLLGKDTEARMRIAERSRELSRTRNMIVHRGYTSIERQDLLTIAHYSWHCCVQGLKMRARFREENSFRQWCLQKKFETLSEEPVDTQQQPKPYC